MAIMTINAVLFIFLQASFTDPRPFIAKRPC
jgi:hypothetical protein